MKRAGLKTVTLYGIIGLFVAIALLPLLKAFAPDYFPTMEGFLGSRPLDCYKKDCPEGSFCQSNQCVPIATRYPNAVPDGNI